MELSRNYVQGEINMLLYFKLQKNLIGLLPIKKSKYTTIPKKKPMLQ